MPKKMIEKENGRFKKFEVICNLLHPPFYTVGFTSIDIILPEEKFKNERMSWGFFLEEYPMSLWD